MLPRAPRTASRPSAGNPCPRAVTSPGRPGPRLSSWLSFSSSGGQSWRGRVWGLSLGGGGLIRAIGDIDRSEGAKADSGAWLDNSCQLTKKAVSLENPHPPWARSFLLDPPSYPLRAPSPACRWVTRANTVKLPVPTFLLFLPRDGYRDFSKEIIP